MNLVSFGGGTNSTAMIIGMYLRKIPIDLIIFADTGAEQPHTYKFIEQFNAWLINHGLPEITTVYTTDKEGNRLFLEAECFERKTLPAIAFGFKTCSQKYKIRPTEKFLNNNAACKAEWAAGRKIIKFIGYDAGETRRVQHGEAANEQNKKIENRYQLYEWGAGSRGMRACDPAGRASASCKIKLLFLSFHEEEGNSSPLGTIPRSISKSGRNGAKRRRKFENGEGAWPFVGVGRLLRGIYAGKGV